MYNLFILWHDKLIHLRFPQVFEDERGLASGEMVLALLITRFLQMLAQVMIVRYPSA